MNISLYFRKWAVTSVLSHLSVHFLFVVVNNNKVQTLYYVTIWHVNSMFIYWHQNLISKTRSIQVKSTLSYMYISILSVPFNISFCDNMILYSALAIFNWLQNYNHIIISHNDMIKYKLLNIILFSRLYFCALCTFNVLFLLDNWERIAVMRVHRVLNICIYMHEDIDFYHWHFEKRWLKTPYFKHYLENGLSNIFLQRCKNCIWGNLWID